MRFNTLLAAASVPLLLIGGACSSASGRKTGIIGDSITDLSQQPLHQALDGDYDLELVGKFGARVDQVMPEAKVIAESKPSRTIINLGTNDAIQQVPIATTRASLDQMVSDLKAVDCLFLVEINESITAQGAPRTDEAKAINDQIREIADTAPNVKILKWNQDIADHGGNGEMTYDTVHLSPRGLVVLADAYKKALDSC